MTENLNTSEQAIEFLDEVAKAVWLSLKDTDPQGARSIKTAIKMVGTVLDTEMALSDGMAECLIGSVREGELREEEALRLLGMWKKMRRPSDKDDD